MNKHLNIFCYLVCFCFIAILFSCHETHPKVSFSKAGWAQQSDPVFPPPLRVAMLQDLVQNHKLVGLKVAALDSLLGKPDYYDSQSASYLISVKYGTDIDPIYSKQLTFSIVDSVIHSYKVTE